MFLLAHMLSFALSFMHQYRAKHCELLILNVPVVVSIVDRVVHVAIYERE